MKWKWRIYIWFEAVDEDKVNIERCLLMQYNGAERSKVQDSQLNQNLRDEKVKSLHSFTRMSFKSYNYQSCSKSSKFTRSMQ